MAANNLNKLNIAIGCDHAGFELKEKLIELTSLNKTELSFKDLGCFSEESVDYPDFGHRVALEVSNKMADYGIIICGSGIGISIAANKINGIRAALCTSVDHAKLSRLHNDANVLALGARLTEEEEIYSIVEAFLSTDFEGGRHGKRINKIEYHKR